ncbi:hypothetical protein FOVSG1_007184 [Fusarium oxysporum f. sp. vasinfectum]
MRHAAVHCPVVRISINLSTWYLPLNSSMPCPRLQHLSAMRSMLIVQIIMIHYAMHASGILATKRSACTTSLAFLSYSSAPPVPSIKLSIS